MAQRYSRKPLRFAKVMWLSHFKDLHHDIHWSSACGALCSRSISELNVTVREPFIISFGAYGYIFDFVGCPETRRPEDKMKTSSVICRVTVFLRSSCPFKVTNGLD